MSRLRRLLPLLAIVPIVLGQAPAPAAQPGSKSWVGRHHEIEEYLKSAECVSLRVFNDVLARCTLRPGGPVASLAWRSRPPGIYRGFKESYKTEIAAYELDKLLKLDMVPPTVERKLDGSTGAAQQWVENVVDGTDPALPDGEARVRWANGTARMMMFDNLIGNQDRNRMNVLRDSAWNVILIDHSRAFGVAPDLPQTMKAIDETLWGAIEGLTRKQLDDTLRAWLDQSEIDAILTRRERMRVEIKSRGK